MGKKKNIVEKFISLIEKKYKSIEKELDEVSSFSSDLEIIEKVVLEESGIEELSKLKEISSEEFQKAISILFKQEEEDLIKSINATYFLINNDIDLVEEQKEKLRELDYRATIKRRSLKRSIEKREDEYAKVEEYIALEDKLKELLESGFVDNDTLSEVFKILKVKDEEKEQYLKEIIAFNYKRFGLLKGQALEEYELLDVSPEVIDVDIPKFTKEELELVFKSHGYDIKILSNELVELLIKEGNIDIIDEVFESIKRNKLDFLANDKKNAKLLTNFLLDSNGELIDEGCKIFKQASVSSKLLRNYVPIFFPSNEEQATNEVVLKRKRRKNTPSEELSDDPKGFVRVSGRHLDFLKNLETLENMGHDRRYLLERQIALLTISNSSLERHIKELELYEMPIHEEGFPLSTLISHKIMENADRFIELGEEEYITKYCSRLYNVREEAFDRLYALKVSNMPYSHDVGNHHMIIQEVYNLNKSCGLTQKEIDAIVPREVDTILNGNKYKDKLDEYLPMEISKEILNKDVVRMLDKQFMRSNLTYNIDGVLISRKKFLRNFDFLMKTDEIPYEEKDIEQILLVSAIYGSKLNMEQIEKVNNGINSCFVRGGDNNELLKK